MWLIHTMYLETPGKKTHIPYKGSLFRWLILFPRCDMWSFPGTPQFSITEGWWELHSTFGCKAPGATVVLTTGKLTSQWSHAFWPQAIGLWPECCLLSNPGTLAPGQKHVAKGSKRTEAIWCDLEIVLGDVYSIQLGLSPCRLSMWWLFAIGKLPQCYARNGRKGLLISDLGKV